MTDSHAFSTRVLYAPSRDLIDLAASQGYTHAVIGSTGHTGKFPADSNPVLLPDYPRYLQAHPEHAAHTTRQLAELRDRARYAQARGLRAILHTYEPSVPYGFHADYPELWSREIASYYASGGPAVQRNKQLCPGRPEVQALLTAKTAELLSALPEIDALSYTNNESNSHTKVWHRCDHCADRPFAANMQALHEALQAGVEAAGTGAVLMYRAWGSHDTDHHYLGAYEAAEALGLHELAGEEWIPAYVRCFGPEHLHFVPSRDVPAFQPYLRQSPSPVIYKASWADTNLHHPLNPFLGTYKPADEICELSVEFCRSAPRDFYLMARENQRRARTCRDAGVRGIAVVPICWGMHPDWSPTCARPSQWMLGDANLTVLAALLRDPDADLHTLVADYLRERYGRALPDALVPLLLDSEEVAADSMNIHGVRSTGSTFKEWYTSIQRYGTMYGDMTERLRPSAERIALMCNEKDANIARAAAMLATIESLRAELPEVAYREFSVCFADLHQRALHTRIAHERMMTAYGLLSGDLQPRPVSLLRLAQLDGAPARNLPPQATSD